MHEQNLCSDADAMSTELIQVALLRHSGMRITKIISEARNLSRA
jgi:hypothetical protein